MSDDDVIVTVAHLRSILMCTREPRHWMKAHGLDWNHFITYGYTATELRATGDALVEGPIRAAIKYPELGRKALERRRQEGL